MTKKSVVITGLFAPFTYNLEGDVEIWGCNRTYIIQDYIPEHPDLTRLFFFDAIARLEHFGHKDFVKHINELEIPVITKRHYPEIPLSKPFPLQEIMEEFRLLHPQKERLSFNELMRQGKPYFTSTIAYMVALAIHEGFDRIILNQLQVYPQSTEYFGQKACINFWLGIAVGRGMDLLVSDNSHLAKGHPWECNLYGYTEQPQGSDMVDWLISNAVQSALRFEHTFVWSPDLEEPVRPGETDVLPSFRVRPALFIEQTAEEFGTVPPGVTKSPPRYPQEPPKDWKRKKKPNGKSPQPA